MFEAIGLMVVLGLILGTVLGVANKFLYVAPDEKVEVLISMLPGYNCGGCGYPGCSGLAEALAGEEVDKVSLCKPCQKDKKAEIITYLNSQTKRDGSKFNIKD